MFVLSCCIISCYLGLSGIDLGNSLIKSVVQELVKEFPHIEEFVTLSPVTGFKQWLETHLKQHTPSRNMLTARMIRVYVYTIYNQHYFFVPVAGDSCRINEGEMQGLCQLYPQSVSHTAALQVSLLLLALIH